MGIVAKVKVNGFETTPPMEMQGLEIVADFENDNVSANINLQALTFVNEANEIIKQWANDGLQTEGIPIEIIVQSLTSFSAFEGYGDFRGYEVNSPVECSLPLVKSNGLNSLDERSKGITMLLLEAKGIMPKSMGVNIPYVVENRKTDLEKIALLTNATFIFKSAIDEMFKFIAIASDITTLGVVQATINLTLTLANIVLLINRLKALVQEIIDTFFGLVRYHRGIKLKTFIERGLFYLGYSVDFGIIEGDLDTVVLCPSKYDEVGLPVGFLPSFETAFSTLSGILKSRNNLGYDLNGAFELINKLFNTKMAIVDNVVHIKTKKDPYWTSTASFIMPDLIIEQSIVAMNGRKVPNNLEELFRRTYISYERDDSDKWTISNVNNSISETIREEISVENQNNVLLKGLEDVQIPYALCIRNNNISTLLSDFQAQITEGNEFISQIMEIFDSVSDLLPEPLSPLDFLPTSISNRIGAMKVENHFFSTPKIVCLQNGKIPSNYISIIGSRALYEKYYAWNSPVPLVKDPTNANNTNQKMLFKNVKIPMGLINFKQIVENSFFLTNFGLTGKFEKVSYNVEGDYAICDYFIYKNFTDNYEETIY